MARLKLEVPLQDCPRCGGKAQYLSDGNGDESSRWVACHECYFKGPKVFLVGAGEKWNKRCDQINNGQIIILEHESIAELELSHDEIMEIRRVYLAYMRDKTGESYPRIMNWLQQENGFSESDAKIIQRHIYGWRLEEVPICKFIWAGISLQVQFPPNREKMVSYC